VLTALQNYGIYTNMNTNNEFDSKFEFNEWESYDLGEDAQLDKYALDNEAEVQARLYQKWSELLVQAQAELSKLKEEEQNVEAELVLLAKKQGIPEVTKPTDMTIKAWVLTHRNYKVVTSKKRRAENNVAYLSNALKVLEHKRSMIKIETDLWITGYYAKPHIPGEVKKELDENRRMQHTNQLRKSLHKRQLRQED